MEEDLKKYNRVVAYIRKSTKDNLDGEVHKQFNSIQFQRKFAKDAISKYELILCHSNFEDSKSGYDEDREGFNSMLQYLIDNKDDIDGIVCLDISRLARNFRDGGMVLWYMQLGIIKRIYTYTKVFTNSSTDQMMIAIELAMAKKSSDDTGDKTKLGMHSKAVQIGHPSQAPVLGYLGKGPRGRREWVVDPVDGPLVKNVFQAFASGNYTLKEISEYAYNIGLKSKMRKSSTKKISPNTWLNRFKDIKYTGIFYDKEQIAGKYEPIISSALFYSVQTVLKGNGSPKSVHLDYAYSAIITCGLCGGKLSGTNKKGITYYRCGKKKLPCKEIERWPYIPEKVLENDLITAFEKMELDEEAWKLARDYVGKISQPEKFEAKNKVRLISENIFIEQNYQNEFGRKLSDGVISKPEYDRFMENSYQIEASLRRDLIKCENLVHELNELMYEFLDNLKYVTKRLRLASSLNKREMVSIFCENLVWKDGKARWDWKKPYFIFLNQTQNSTVLPR